MKKIVLVLALILTGCAGQNYDASTGWETNVKPTDPVPRECREAPDRKPRLAKSNYDGEQSAQAYAKLNRYTRDMLGRYERCRTWAKKQRD